MPKLFIEHIRAKVSERLRSVEQSILIGSPQTFDEYRERVGKAKAFRTVLVDLDDELKKYIEDDYDNF